MCLTRPMDFDVNPRHWVYNCFLVIPPLLLTTAGRAGPGTPRLVWSQYCPSGFSEPGHEAQHGAGERVPAGGSRVEGGQVRGGRRGAAQAWASQVELLAPGGDPQLCPRCCGSGLGVNHIATRADLLCTSFISYELSAVIKYLSLSIHRIPLLQHSVVENNFETIGWRPNFDFNFAHRCKRRWAGRKGKNI